ncbi:hypothetical protein [Nocardioides stalactiti]|uniref:hypothetical protein n=1 Tax=Nocardioides stalactiti TaxID=2755356 RepID=UPI001602EAB1|nr:hypothetical protein [Nocardioides stalactiti]
MNAHHALDVRLFEHLSACELPAARHDLAVDLCSGIIALLQEMDVPHRGRAARSVAQLMLGESVPDLDPAVRNDLARLCEVAVVRGL